MCRQNESAEFHEGYRACKQFLSYAEGVGSACRYDDDSQEAKDWDRGWAEASADYDESVSFSQNQKKSAK